MWRRKTLAEIMAQELAEARRELLAGETAVEFAKSIVSYNHARIKRLEARLEAPKRPVLGERGVFNHNPRPPEGS